MENKEEMSRISVDISTADYKQLRLRALEADTTVTDLIRKMVSFFLSQPYHGDKDGSEKL